MSGWEHVALGVGAEFWQKGRRRIYRTDDGSFVISEGGTWLPGSYADFATAERAFDLPDERLQAIQDELNRTRPPSGRVITAAMLG